VNVILKIEGRDAIPVRAIPLLTNWEVLSPDELADALAGGEHGYAFHDIFAYRIEDSEVRPVVQTWWENFPCRALKALSDRIKATEISHETGYQEWRKQSLNELPAGVFVWKDEFEPRYLRRYGRHGTTFMTAAGDVMSEDEQQRRVVLNFAPFIAEPEIRCLILEGFESEVAACATQTTPCDEFTVFSPLFAPWIESPFEALPKSLQDQWRTESMVAWDVLAPHQRKFFLQQHDFKNDPSTQVERTAAWLKYTMDADMWWRTEADTEQRVECTAPLVDSANDAPMAKTKAKRRTWWDVSSPYIVEVMQAGQYATCKELYRALEAKTGSNSPFDKGTGHNLGNLFVRDIAQPLNVKTIQNRFSELRELAQR